MKSVSEFHCLQKESTVHCQRGVRVVGRLQQNPAGTVRKRYSVGSVFLLPIIVKFLLLFVKIVRLFWVCILKKYVF
jgi:hypothetical protein